jgi:hypothetical protein
MSHSLPPEGPPPFDSDAVGRVASHVDLLDVHLLGCHFERSDDSSTSPALSQPFPPSTTGIDMEWEVQGDSLGLIASFSTLFEEEPDEQDEPDDVEAAPDPFTLVARFRLLYSLAGLDPIDDNDILQFVSWNAIFNAWPYWREFAGEITRRSRIDVPVIPVLGIPRG